MTADSGTPDDADQSEPAEPTAESPAEDDPTDPTEASVEPDDVPREVKRVKLVPGVGLVKRRIAWEDGGSSTETVWPIWVPPAQEKTAADRFHEYWKASTDQTRSTAKWMATVLGAALAALLGTAPLTGLRNTGVTPLALTVAVIGLLLIGITLFLVVRVLIPVDLNFRDLCEASYPGGKPPRGLRKWLAGMRHRGALARLRADIESSEAVALPLGIKSLADLADRVRVEELTLTAIAQTLGSEKTRKNAEVLTDQRLKDAQEGRASWLAHLTNTMERWTTVASFAGLRAKADLAKTVGITAAILGVGCIVVAFLLPVPARSPAGFTDYRLTDAARERLADTLGIDCRRFDGHQLSKEGKKVTLLVKENDQCASARITVSEDDLGPSGQKLPAEDVSE